MDTERCSDSPDQTGETAFRDAFVAFQLVPHKKLRATEKINIWRARSLAQKIKSEGVWSVPILVEKDHFVVMDGHHRLWAAQELGLRQVPCVLTGYDNPYLSLTSWVGGKGVTPDTVVSAGISGALLDYKTTRHILTKELHFPTYSVADLQRGS